MRERFRNWWWLLLLMSAKLAIHMLVADQYGFHRDEYLYLAHALRPGWGYMEVPPLLAWLGAVVLMFGKGIYMVKFIPALFGTATLGLVAFMTRDFGGDKWAQFLACLVFLSIPAYLRTHHLFQPVFLNQFFWTLLIFGSIRLFKTQNSKWWMVIGVIGGLGMLAKYSMLFPLAGLFAALLLTDQRKWLKRREPYLAATIALLLFLPNLLWQYNHLWPIIGHMQELSETQLINVSPLGFVLDQFLMLFAGCLIWLPGLFWLFRGPRTFRPVGWIYLAIIVILLAGSGKSYYSLGIYPALVAAGAVFWEQVAAHRPVFKWSLPAVIVVLNLFVVPYGLPVLSIEKMMDYGIWMRDKMHVRSFLVWEDGRSYDLPQDYADMYGWEEMVQNVARFYHTLPPQERAQTRLWGGSYGHAASLLFYHEKYDLPDHVSSFSGSFQLWLDPTERFTRQIEVDDGINLQSDYWSSVELVDSNRNIFARDPGYVHYKSEPKVEISSAWAQIVAENRRQWSRKSR